MPKRKNPFGEITPLQRKMHVGFDQMATQEEIHAMFEKTKYLLFKGAMGVANGLTAQPPPSLTRENERGHCALNGVCQQLPPEDGITNSQDDRVKNRGLLNYFTLSHNGTRECKRALIPAIAEEVGKRGRAGVCIGCNGHQKGVWSCYHCERLMCSDCTRYCCRCRASFCPNCSTLNYEESEPRSFCLSCIAL